jgi:hypothetical protein
MKTSRWTPLLSGTTAESAVAAAREIAVDIAGLSRPEEISPSYGLDVAASLATGSAGLGIALVALDRAGVFPGGAVRGRGLMDSATDAMAEIGMEPDLFGGFTGVAWAVAHLSDGEEGDEEDPLSAVDPEVFGLVEEPAWEGHFDLVSGLVGIGVYALERLPRPAAARCLDRVVVELGARAEARGRGLAWRSRPEHLSPLQRERSPGGWYDLGVAHGVPGVVGLLGQACAAGAGGRRARELLEGAVAWVQEERASSPGGTPYWSVPGTERRPARSAWCYGDPGVAAVLLVAARCVGEPRWEKAAREIALEAAARPADEAGVVDANLCHGAAGVAHIFNRIFQRTGDGDLGSAATEWFERALAMRRPGTGRGGFLTALRSAEGPLTYEPDPSLLSGSAGIAMALAAASSPVEPCWDRMLLLSSRLER